MPTVEQFQQAVDDVRRLAKAKPFVAVPVTFSNKNEGYGKPAAGSKSEARGKYAAKHVNAELQFLCDMVYQEGVQYPDGTAAITFGALFQIFTVINNKVVGLLMRARKHGLLYFEGEMLFQRRDDDKPIVLIKPIEEIRRELSSVEDFELGQSAAASSKQ